MEISNKTLAMFLVAAIVVSLAGTIISLNKLDSFGYTGLATTQVGNVTLNVQSTISITTADDHDINFGSCSPQSGVATLIRSNTNGGGTENICPSFTADEILVRNDGNVDANVTINASDYGEAHSGTFVPSSSSTSFISYNISNASSAGSYNGGCAGKSQYFPWNITSTNNSFLLGCSNLTADVADNSFELDVEVNVPNDALVGSDEVIFTFLAESPQSEA